MDDPLAKQYKNMIELLLPSEPNNLQILKFIDSRFYKTVDSADCKEANDEFEDIERVKKSLSNLRGLVYSNLIRRHDDNLFFDLTRNILSNLASFKKLESIHIHSKGNELTMYLNQNNVNALSQITELCISVSLNVNDNTAKNLHRWTPKLQKLCLVIDISEITGTHMAKFKQIIENILSGLHCLKLFQIVFDMNSDDDDDKGCLNKIVASSELIRILYQLFPEIRHKQRSTL